jgi:hypothetical protein
MLLGLAIEYHPPLPLFSLDRMFCAGQQLAQGCKLSYAHSTVEVKKKKRNKNKTRSMLRDPLLSN